MVALTVTPALCLLLLRNVPLEHRESPLLRWLQSGYQRLLGQIIQAARPIFFTVAVLGAGIMAEAGIAFLPALQEPLLPSFKEPDIVVQWQGPPGTSYPEMVRVTTLASRELRAIAGIRNVAADIGRAVLGDQVVDVNSAQLAISIDPTANYDATVDAIRKVVAGYPGLRSQVQTYLKETTSQVLTGSSNDIVVRISGPDLGVLRSKAEEVRRGLAQINGTVDVHTELQVEQPQVDIKVDLAKAQRYGLKPGDVRRAASTLIAGIEAGSLFESQKVFQVMVWGTPQTRHSLSSIRDLLIDTPDGGQVRLGDIATVSIVPTPNLIQHETVSRRIDVGLNVRGRSLDAVVGEIKQRLTTVNLPFEYHATVLGEYQERQAAQRNLLIFSAVSAIGVFLLLQAAFGSWRQATLVFFTLPAALVGGVLVAFAVGSSLSLAALIGLFAVFGIAARNCLMLINHCRHLERREGASFGPELVLEGARNRFAPILMSALATVVVLLPPVIFGNIPGQEIVQPMAIVILGGLITSTILNLFIVPVLYLRYGASPQARSSTENPQESSQMNYEHV